MGNANVPYLPPMSPYVLPGTPFDTLLGQYGVNLLWLQSNQCACVYGGDMPGSPDPDCTSCHGRGVYWNAPYGPFQGLITYATMAPNDREPGVSSDPTYGAIQSASPILTLPASAGIVYEQASLYDAFVEIDSIQRFTCSLRVGGDTALPYQQNVSVAASGAVTVYDQQTHEVSSTNDYVFASGSVILNGYPVNTSYTVQYTASPAYIAFGKSGGMAHTRPFGQGQVALPKRLQLQLLDLFTRSSNGGSGSTSPQAVF